MSANASGVEIPDVAEVLRIAGVSDLAIRNLRITECYHRLARALTARFGQCANWCTFSTWASRQAGSTIRGEDFLEKLSREAQAAGGLLHPVRSFWRALLRRGLFTPETKLGRLVRAIHSPFDAFERASSAVAKGNLKVFEEIGYEFARYLQECSADSTPESIEFQTFLSAFRPGDPPEGQKLLRQAFTRYHRQPPAETAGRRAQRLAGNAGVCRRRRTSPHARTLRAGGRFTGRLRSQGLV